MYSKKLIFLFAIIYLLSGVSCSHEEERSEIPSLIWGKSIFYNDFIWEKYVPDTLTRVLRFDFNQDARLFMKEPLAMTLVKKNGDDRYEPVSEQEAVLFLDGNRCADNIILIDKNKKQAALGIVFNWEMSEGNYFWYLKIVDPGGLDRINDLEAGEGDLLVQEIQVIRDKHWNPLALWCLIIAVVLIVLLAVWMLVLRPLFYPTFKVGKIMLRDPVPYMSNHRLSGKRALVLTSKAQKQGLLSRIFTNRIQYDINPLWVSDVVITPRNRKSVRIKTTGDYIIDSRILEKGKEYKLRHIKSQTITIITTL